MKAFEILYYEKIQRILTTLRLQMNRSSYRKELVRGL